MPEREREIERERERERREEVNEGRGWNGMGVEREIRCVHLPILAWHQPSNSYLLLENGECLFAPAVRG